MKAWHKDTHTQYAGENGKEKDAQKREREREMKGGKKEETCGGGSLRGKTVHSVREPQQSHPHDFIKQVENPMIQVLLSKKKQTKRVDSPVFPHGVEPFEKEEAQQRTVRLSKSIKQNVKKIVAHE